MMKFILSNNTTYEQVYYAMPHLNKSCLNAIFYCLGNSQESKSKAWKNFWLAQMLYSLPTTTTKNPHLEFIYV